MGEPLNLMSSSEIPPSPIAAMGSWGFWCRTDSIGLDEATRKAIIEGVADEMQQFRAGELVRRAQESLIATDPASKRAS